jgi:hypothetical protein
MDFKRSLIVAAFVFGGCSSDGDSSETVGGTETGPATATGSSTGTSDASTSSSTSNGDTTSSSTTDDSTTGGTSGATSGAGATTAPGPDLGPGCDPSDPEMEITPGPGDKEGDPCCSDKESCTGQDVMGQPPQTYHVGDGLICVDGKWIIDDAGCVEVCESKGNVYLGCFWDSEYGLYKPLCGCQKP